MYNWIINKASKNTSIYWLVVVSFIESSFFPIPPDLLLIPIVLALPSRWIFYATISTIASVIGGYLGYAIGALAMATIGIKIIHFFNLEQSMQALKSAIDHYGAWIILIKGLTPIPYKLLTITAGAFHLNLWSFTLASIGARAIRFFLVAGLVSYYGSTVIKFIEKRLFLITSLMALTLILLFVAIHFIFRH